MRFAIVATGGVGGYFGGKLARAGADVTFIARGAHLAAIRERGLEVKGAGDGFLVRPAKATDDLGAVGIVDTVLVAVKTWQLPDLAPKLRSMVGPKTLVLPLLNGVDATAQLAQALGPDCVLGGLCNVISWVAGPGTIEHLGASSSVTFGELSGKVTPRVDALRDALTSAAIKAVVPVDITAAIWRKFAFITSFGGVGAVARAPAGTLRAIAPVRELLAQAVGEVFTVGRARGVGLDGDEVAKTMAYFDTLPPDGFASMARDLFAGKRSELDAWNGAVARLGRDAGVPTPVHDFIFRSLLPTELRARGEVAFQGPS
jgi:2-dehydropantoate 2-reductase